MLSGCATMINASTQDVPVIMPRGTRVTDISGELIPVVQNHTYGDSITTIRLERKRDYHLQFSYKGTTIGTTLASSLDWGWIIPDYLTLIGLFVDAITNDWCYFDGVKVRFPGDSTSSVIVKTPSIEVFELPEAPKIGLIALVNTGFVYPIGNAEFDFVFFNCYRLGFGYEFSRQLSIIATYGQGAGIDIMPSQTKYETFGYYSSYDLEARFSVQKHLYLVCGGGWTHITSDTLKTFIKYVADSGAIYRKLPPADTKMPTLFLGIGYTGSVGFIEIRHSYGLSKIFLSSGEIGHFTTTSLNFGLNLHF